MIGQRNQLIIGDARQVLPSLPPGSVDMLLTSPPYFRLRDYAVDGQLGVEDAVDDWAEQVASVIERAGPALVPTASVWLNLGDSYATQLREGAARKSLLLGPERVALRLVANGWVLRNKIIWQKSNPMPSSVRDRLSCTWEVVYVFTKQSPYYFDLDTIRVPHLTQPSPGRSARARAAESWRGPNSGSTTGIDRLKIEGRVGHPLGKNPGDVWRLASSGYRGGHHATFPMSLAARAIQAGSPEARCARCHAPWHRPLLRSIEGAALRAALAPTCGCPPKSEPSVVLDPFFGAGTTAVAAEQLRRDWLGIELNPAYAALAQERIHEARAGPPARAEAAS